MTIAQSSSTLQLIDHTHLPESDGSIVKNFQEHPQSLLLTSSIRLILNALHPDGQYAIGQDSGIYWRLTDPPELSCEAPDWFYVPNVPPLLNGKFRRSYLMWQKVVIPLIAIEFVSGDGSEKRDQTSPLRGDGTKAGKFWVYEQAIRIPYYTIFDAQTASVDVFKLNDVHCQPCLPNQRGHYPFQPLGVELGIWLGSEGEETVPWLRWWDSQGNLLLTGDERAEQEKQRADRLTARLREMGLDPDQI